MADAVTTQTIQDGGKTAILRFTNVSDGTGESAVAKIDVSSLAVEPITNAACTSVVIEKIYYQTIGMGVKIFFDASTDDFAWELAADWADTLDFSDFGIPDPKSTGTTGDVLFTTTNASNNDVYVIVMQVRKRY